MGFPKVGLTKIRTVKHKRAKAFRGSPRAQIFPRILAGTETKEETADKHVCIELKNSAVTEDIKKNVRTQKLKLELKT